MNNSNHDGASRSTLKGTGSETVIGPLKDGGNETVHSFGWYLRTMISDVKKRDAIPLVSGMVPQNSWEGGKFRHEWPMAKSAETVAHEEKVEYVDHTKYTADRLESLGEGKVKQFFPNDSTHTNSEGARGE
jgi:rhamnogalacturonan acetylesterase